MGRRPSCGLAIDPRPPARWASSRRRFGGLAAEGLGGGAVRAAELVPVADADPTLLVWADEFDYAEPPRPSCGATTWEGTVGAIVRGRPARARARVCFPSLHAARARARLPTGELQCYPTARRTPRAGRRPRVQRPRFGRPARPARLLGALVTGPRRLAIGRVQAWRLRGSARGCWARCGCSEGARGGRGAIDVMEMVETPIRGRVQRLRARSTRAARRSAARSRSRRRTGTCSGDLVVDRDSVRRGRTSVPSDGGVGGLGSGGLRSAVPSDFGRGRRPWGGQRGVDEDAFSGEGQVRWRGSACGCTRGRLLEPAWRGGSLSQRG